MVWHIAQDMMTLGFVDCRMYSTKGKLLEHNLDPEVRDALQSLKQQLRTGNNWIFSWIWYFIIHQSSSNQLFLTVRSHIYLFYLWYFFSSTEPIFDVLSFTTVRLKVSEHRSGISKYTK